jgi:hypothetical protein
MRRLSLTSLSDRRTRGDCIQAYKIMSNRDIVNWHVQPVVIKASYGHRPRLIRELVSNCAQRYNFYTNRIVNDWNALADATVESKSVEIFKYRYDSNKKLNK